MFSGFYGCLNIIYHEGKTFSSVFYDYLNIIYEGKACSHTSETLGNGSQEGWVLSAKQANQQIKYRNNTIIRNNNIYERKYTVSFNSK